MLGIPCSQEHLSLLGLQMIGPISLTLYYLIGALPFWRQLPFNSLFGHQTHFPEDPVTDLKLPEAYCFVKVPSRSILISRPGNLSIIFFFFPTRDPGSG